MAGMKSGSVQQTVRIDSLETVRTKVSDLPAKVLVTDFTRIDIELLHVYVQDIPFNQRAPSRRTVGVIIAFFFFLSFLGLHLSFLLASYLCDCVSRRVHFIRQHKEHDWFLGLLYAIVEVKDATYTGLDAGEGVPVPPRPSTAWPGRRGCPYPRQLAMSHLN